MATTDLLSDVYRHNRVTSTRQLIHFLVAGDAIVQPCVDQLNGLFVVANWHYREILNIDLTKFQIFPDLQFSVAWVQQIIDLLPIDLHE